jgi:hypothetical protein
LEEANIKVALELAYDNSSLEEAGEVATNLLDDYFYDDNEEDHKEDDLHDVGFWPCHHDRTLDMFEGLHGLPWWKPEN